MILYDFKCLKKNVNEGVLHTLPLKWNLTTEYLWFWGSCFGALRCVEYPIIVITSR